MSRLLTQQRQGRRTPASRQALPSEAGPPPAPDRGAPLTATVPGETPTPRPRLTRSRHLPPRDALGAVCGTVEVTATAPSEQRERFRVLAITLHRRWFLERPSSLNATRLNATPPTITTAPTATAC